MLGEAERAVIIAKGFAYNKDSLNLSKLGPYFLSLKALFISSLNFIGSWKSLNESFNYS